VRDHEIARLDRVTVETPNLRLLDSVSLTLHRGEIVAVVGPSGSGKTTLLRTLNYLTPITSGWIDVAGFRLVPGMSERRNARLLCRLRQSVGMVFQHFHLFPHLSILENLVEAPSRLRRLDPKRAQELAYEGLDRLGLLHVAHAYPRRLSGGEQQRVALLRALMMEPEVLLLDEPTSALDAGSMVQVCHLLQEFRSRGKAVLLVTHQAQLVTTLATRVAVLVGGRLVAEGKTEAMYPSGPGAPYLGTTTNAGE
jgi:polar amino acid transport system ATP-binding protein